MASTVTNPWASGLTTACGVFGCVAAAAEREPSAAESTSEDVGKNGGKNNKEKTPSAMLLSGQYKRNYQWDFTYNIRSNLNRKKHRWSR